MANEAQIDYWNSQAGLNWVRHADKLDRLLEPFIARLLEPAALGSGEHVLDVGCGAGALTLEAARRVGPDGGAVGVDVSAPLLELASHRAAKSGLPATFVREDASLFRAERPLDGAVSRFGVMFFDAPVMAFTALRRNLRPEGRLAFVCWAPLAENPWARLAIDALRSLEVALPEPPPPGAPGPFAFADADRIRSILADSGWRGVTIEPFRTDLSVPGETNDERAKFLMEMGPAARILRELEIDQARLEEAIMQRLSEAPVKAGLPQLASSTWIVSATAS